MQDFKTPLDMAANEETKALLREHGGKFSFLGAVEKGMLEELSEFIKEGADVNLRFEVCVCLHSCAFLCVRARVPHITH